MAKADGTLKKPNGTAIKRETSKSQSTQNTLSEEVVVDSSSDAESDSDPEVDAHDERTAELVAKQATGKKSVEAIKKQPSSEESSEESSEDDSDSDDVEEAHTPTPAKGKTPAQVHGVKRKSSAEEEEAAAAAAESDGESDHKSKKAKVTFKESATTTPASTQPSANQVLPVTPFDPPRGYKETKITDEGPLSRADLKGKVIWHISAPPDIPLSSLSGISQATIDSKKPVLNHNGIDYVLVEAEPVQSAILLPGPDGYKSAGKAVAKTYSLRPAFTLPTIPAIAASRNAGSSVAANIATAAVTTIRPQPKGLKMRCKPPGFGIGKIGRIGDSSDEEDNEDSIYQFPKAVGPSTDGDGIMLGDGVAKQKKKEKRSKHDKEKINGIAPDKETRPAPAAEDNSEADEARRKAEKKAKKAAKRKALEQS